MSTFSKTAREVEMPNGDVVVLHNAVTENTTSNIKKFKYDDNGHVTESTAANATDLNLNSYSTPTTGSTAIGTSDAVQTAIGKLDHQSQIDQSNILYGLEKIGTNLIKTRDDLPTVVTALPEGIRIQRANTTSSFAYVKCGTVYLESGKKYVLYDATYSPSTKHHYFYVDCGGNGFVELSTPSITATVQYGTGRTTGTYDIYTRIDANSTVDTISTPIICLESVWKQLDAYTPYALPNYDLTRLEAEDRASLAEVVDSGAKNIFEFRSLDDLKALNSSGTWNNNAYTVSGVTFTVDTTNKTIATSGTSTAMISFVIDAYSTATTKFASYVLSGCPTGGNYDTGYYMYTTDASSNTKDKDLGEGCIIGSSAISRIRIGCRSGVNMSSKTFKPMLCTKAAFGVSNKFVPYRPNYDLVGSAVNRVENSLKPWALLKSGDDLNNIVSAMVSRGVYFMFATGNNYVSNIPTDGIFMVRTTWLGGGTAVQEVTMLTGNDRDKSYVRTFIDNNNWSAWKQTTNV